MLPKLLLPRIDLVGVDFVALGKIGHSRLSASKAIFAFNAASIFRLVFVIIRSSLPRSGRLSN